MNDKIKVEKRKTESLWLEAFPSLRAYAQNKLYKVIGPTVMGIELIKLPRTEEYRPHFVCYPLWKESIKECLNAPVILTEFYDNKGLQFAVSYEKQDAHLPKVLSAVKNQVLIPFDRDVSLRTVFKLVDHQFNDILIKNHSGKQAALYEFKLYCALYTSSNEREAQDIINQIKHKSSDWDMSLFKMWFGDFHEWLESLHNRINKRDEFLTDVQINKQNKKIEKMNQFELKP